MASLTLAHLTRSRPIPPHLPDQDAAAIARLPRHRAQARADGRADVAAGAGHTGGQRVLRGAAARGVTVGRVYAAGAPHAAKRAADVCAGAAHGARGPGACGPAAAVAREPVDRVPRRRAAPGHARPVVRGQVARRVRRERGRRRGRPA
jgi:hypothetical protein